MSGVWKGVYPAVVTPFDKNGEVSFSDYEKHLEFLAHNGVHGIVPCATTGESPTLLAKERERLFKIAREVATRRQIKFIAGCSGNSTPAVMRLVEESAELGADAVLIATPYYNKPTQAGLMAHYESIADVSSLPIFLYNVPSRTGVNLAPVTVEKLCQHPKIIGIKEASGQHHQWLELSNRLNLQKTSLLSGDDDGFATILALGGSGMISASANVAPAKFVEIYHAHARGDLAQAFELQKRLLPLIDVLFLETNPAPAKYALELLGHMQRQVRLPLVSVSDSTAQQIADVLKNYELGHA